jgi:nucleotide-binding universal stress UspA family protein
MNIKATLARLSSSLPEGCSVRDLLLLCAPEHATEVCTEVKDVINIVVGYNGSQKSQAALDLTLLMAYQTRLATRKRVVVQAVYVLEGMYPLQKQSLPTSTISTAVSLSLREQRAMEQSAALASTATVLERRSQSRRSTVNCVDVRAAQIQHFEEADQVLWHARNFATEWRGSLNTHLRFGSPAIELSQVAEQEQAHLMIIGCRSAEHPLVEQLKAHYRCPIVGIPASAEWHAHS